MESMGKSHTLLPSHAAGSVTAYDELHRPQFARV